MQWDREQLLDALGLQRKPASSEQLLPALGIFGAGILLGVGVALLMAPTSGARARSYVAQNSRKLAKGLRRRDPAEFDRVETSGHKGERLGDLPNGVSMKS